MELFIKRESRGHFYIYFFKKIKMNRKKIKNEISNFFKVELKEQNAIRKHSDKIDKTRVAGQNSNRPSANENRTETLDTAKRGKSRKRSKSRQKSCHRNLHPVLLPDDEGEGWF